MTASAPPRLAREVLDAVRRDLNHAIVLTSSDVLLKSILGIIDQSLHPSLQRVIDEHYNKKEKRWLGFPQSASDDLESLFYKPFVNLANVINKQTQLAYGNDGTRVQGTWVDCHATTPDVTTNFVAKLRPDCAFVASPESVFDLGNRYDALNSNLKSSTDKRAEVKREMDKLLDLWWSQMNVLVEVKTPKKEDRHDQQAQYFGALPQLAAYVRQMFRQQLDRRFILGITVSFRNIAVWLCDRSGALEMSDVYGIHSDPQTFVHIISAISRLPSYRLGWDPTMMLYSRSQGFAYSYGLRWTRTNPPPELSTSKWLLALTNGPQTREIILDGPPMLARTAEVMNGRAVQVHQGYWREDQSKHFRRPLVVKTSWQPVVKMMDGKSLEAFLYGSILAFKPRLLAASIVKANHGWGANKDSVDIKVSTFQYIRKGIQADLDRAQDMNMKVEESLFKPADLNERGESLAHMAYGNATLASDYIYFSTDLSKLTDRVQSRIVLDVWGWSLKDFTNLKELLRVIADAVRDHKNMLLSGVLHRDMSDGNIIIQPQPPKMESNIWTMVSHTSGKLIDLDHSKATTARKTVGEVPMSTGVQLNIQLLNVVHKIQITADAVTQAMRFVPQIPVQYCSATTRFNVLRSDKRGSWTAEDLGWYDVGPQPDFDEHIPNVVTRTGTVPFISHKMLGSCPDAHNAIHDLESLWWVIVHLCLTRECGCGRRRVYDKEHDDFVKNLYYSGENDLASEKEHYFRLDGGKRLDELFGRFSPYFKPLTDLLKRWRDMLVLGYTFKAYEYHLVHAYVLEFIDDALQLPQVQSEQDTAFIQGELKRRAMEYTRICNIPNSFQSSVNSSHNPPPPMPPSFLSPSNRQGQSLSSQSTSTRAPSTSSTTHAHASASTRAPAVSSPTAPAVPGRTSASNFPPSASAASPSSRAPATSAPITQAIPGRASASNIPSSASASSYASTRDSNSSAVPRQTPTSPKKPVAKKPRNN